MVIQQHSLSTLPLENALVVIAKVSDWMLGDFNDVLSASELDRQRAFKNESDQRRYMVAHSVKRYVLSKYADSDPVALAFSTMSHGKPYATDSRVPYFNLSHSGNYVVLAISRESEVGIDIEFPRNMDLLRIMQRIGSEIEYKKYQQSNDKMSSFLNFWTQKEAVSKLSGRGIALGLKTITVSGETGHGCCHCMGRSCFIHSWHYEEGVISYASFLEEAPLISFIC